MSKRNEQIKLTAPAFQKCDTDYVSGWFVELGFRTVDQLLNIRVFDMMNLNRISRNRAEGMAFALYCFFNRNHKLDAALDAGIVKQSFDYTGWHKKHPKYENLTVKDLVLAEDINAQALSHLWKLTVRSFFRSNEYDSRRYRYIDFDDYELARKEREKEGKSE